MMPHGKHFLYGLCGTVKGRLGWAGDEMQAFCPQVERIIANTHWLRDVDFDTIHYVMRFGAERETPIYCRKRPRFQELEVASQESMASLHKVFLDRIALRRFLAAELMRVLTFIQTKYELPDNETLFKFLGIQAGMAEQTHAPESAVGPISNRDSSPPTR